MHASPPHLELRDLPIGCRLLVRSRTAWRAAVVARIDDEAVVLSVASPMGRNYRLRRPFDAEIRLDGRIPFLFLDTAESWRENFVSYDLRW
jgi:hypothetical protein